MGSAPLGDPTVNLALVAVLTTCVGGLIWIIKYMFTHIRPLLESLVEATRLNTQATESADEYLRQRNGRDMEFHREVMIGLKEIPKESKRQASIVAKELKKVGDKTAEQVALVAKQRYAMPKQTVVDQTVIEQHVHEVHRDPS